jgi:hypothetical protein
MKKLITLLCAVTVLWSSFAKAEMGAIPCPVQLVNLQTLPDDPLNSPSGAVSFNFTGSPSGFVVAALFDDQGGFLDNIQDDGNGNFSYFPLAAGNYIVSYLDVDESCGADVPFSISSGSCTLPTPTISLSGSPFLCDGSSITLTSSEATGNSWSTGETTQSITVSTSGNYTVSVSDGICTVSSVAQNIQVVPNPDVPTISASGSTTFCDGGSVTLTVDPPNNPPPGGAPTYMWSTSESGTSIMVSLSGFYSVTVMDGNGCSATSSSTEVIVNSNPNPSITASGSTTFCDGGDVTLDAGAGFSSYAWSNGESSQTTTVSSSNTLFVTVIDANGCSGTSSPTSVTVNPNPNPIITTSTGGTVLCTGTSMSLLSSEPTGNFWSNGGNLPATSIQTGGDYFLTVVDANNCSGSTQITITEANCTPTTTLRSADCGRIDFALTGIMLANPVVGATKYEFEFSLNGNVYATKLQNSNQLSIASVTPAFNWGTTYQVRVRVYIGTTIGNYGSICNISFIADPNNAGVPTTQLVSANCGRLNFPTNGALGANPVSGATRYEFEFSQGGNVYATRLSLNRFCGFNVVSPALQAGQQYDVRVRVHIGNVIGNYGPVCTIGLVSGARFNPSYVANAADYELQAGEEFPIQLDATGNAVTEIAVMPNPFSENATMFVGNLDAAYTVSVFNVEGKLVESMNNQNQNNIVIGNNLENGIYFVELRTENGFIQRTKIVKAN